MNSGRVSGVTRSRVRAVLDETEDMTAELDFRTLYRMAWTKHAPVEPNRKLFGSV